MAQNSDDETSSPPIARSRQMSGAACDECRRRKLRCDRQRPQCGVCCESGVRCETDRSTGHRGPKKGYLKALKNRVAVLENRLSVLLPQDEQDQEPDDEQDQDEDQGQGQWQEQATQSLESVSLAAGFPNFTDLTDPTDGTSIGVMGFQHPSFQVTESIPAPDFFSPTTLSSRSSIPASLGTQANIQISEFVQAELDQLYFDRVHTSILILHQRRYLTWSRNTVKDVSSRCLQSAMWTLASLLSAQFQHLHESLYQETKQLLQSLSIGSDDRSSVDTKQIQAWILVATYESIRTHHWQAWMSAGRAFRMVQLMELHKIDDINKAIITDVTDLGFSETEEKRRVFWMAYWMDHLFSIRNNWPITLTENVVYTRLPAPDEAFQSGRRVLGVFLSAAMTENSPRILSPLNECVILATICGRSLFHGQQYNMSCLYGETTPNWLEKHRWLDDILTNRLQILSQYYASSTDSCDPMILFANIMAQATVISLFTAMESVMWASNEEKMAVEKYQQRAALAAEELVRLAKALTEFHIFKLHPFMPIPLILCAEFLYNKRSYHESFSMLLQELLEVFGQLKNVNNPEQSYIQLLHSARQAGK